MNILTAWPLISILTLALIRHQDRFYLKYNKYSPIEWIFVTAVIVAGPLFWLLFSIASIYYFVRDTLLFVLSPLFLKKIR